MSATGLPLWGSTLLPSHHGQYGNRFTWRLRDREQQRPGLSWRFFLLGLFLLFLTVAGGFVYIREITTTTESGYDVSLLERRDAELRAEEQQLQIEAAELESLQHIEERLKTLNLTPVDSVAYTSPLITGAVAGTIPVGTARR